MQEIRGIHHIGIRVAELARTRAFYERLGFVFVAGPIGPEPVAVMQHASGITLNFILNAEGHGNILMDSATKHPGYTHMALNVDDLDRVQRKLKALDIPITEGPVLLPDGSRMLFVRDPDANVIEFHAPADEP